jgi:hypothetical protein
LVAISARAAETPGASFPKMATSSGELEGIYRFFRNQKVTLDQVLAPHAAATVERCEGRDVLVIHDTTVLRFGGNERREGMGWLHKPGGQQGFLGHFALAVEQGEARIPLGVLGVRTVVRTGKRLGRADHLKRLLLTEGKESDRWRELALAVHEQLPNAIHLIDREGDAYTLLRAMTEQGLRFIVRISNDRQLAEEKDGEAQTLFAKLDGTEAVFGRTVPLSRRNKKSRPREAKEHPERDERLARLAVSGCAVEIKAPAYRTNAGEPATSLKLNAVLVREIDVPEGEPAVTWRLLTTEPVDTAEQLEAVVDAYRSRWTIEEYFKALKTGCGYEKRQLESLDALVNALGVFAVIAWRLLLLRSAARAAPMAPAVVAVTPRQLSVMQTLAKSKHPRAPQLKLSEAATAREAMLAIARLGGHLSNNGEPGWQVLGRGLEALLLIELGWELAKAHSTSDQ